MNKKLIITTAVTISIAALVATFSVLSSEIALFEKYPYLDQKVVVKAHRIMVRRTLSGKYNLLDLDNDDICDEIFLGIVMELTAK